MIFMVTFYFTECITTILSLSCLLLFHILFPFFNFTYHISIILTLSMNGVFSVFNFYSSLGISLGKMAFQKGNFMLKLIAALWFSIHITRI